MYIFSKMLKHLFFLSLSITAFAQTPPGIEKPALSNAILQECHIADNPQECTQEKLEIDISNLITYDMTKNIEESLRDKYFSISVIFVTDENGKVIPQETEVHCDNLLFKSAIENYIKALPSFLPKNNNDTEKRTLHTVYQTYMFDYVIDKYYPASKERLALEKIYPKYVLGDTPPLYPGCKCKKEDKKTYSNECSIKKTKKFIMKNFIVPQSNGIPRAVKIYASYIVEKDGTITIKRIVGAEEELNKEMERVIMQFPKFTPGSLKGFPMRTSLNYPVTITFHQ